MLRRAGVAVVAVLGGLLAVIALLTGPGATLVLVAIAVLVVGPLVALCVHSSRPGGAIRAGALAATSVVAVGLVVAGLAALLGAVAGPVVVLLLVPAGIWARRRWPAWRNAATAPVPSVDPRPVAVPRPRMPVVRIDVVSTAGLCATWQRTYWLLRDVPPGDPGRDAVVAIRSRLLDEFERRDPDGFVRWLQSEPRACGDPGRYLTVDR